MTNRLISILLSIAVILTPQSAAAATTESLVSPVPKIGGDHACKGNAPDPDKCKKRKDVVSGKEYVYPKVNWEEIESRPLTMDEWQALRTKYRDFGLKWGSGGGYGLFQRALYKTNGDLADWVAKRGVYSGRKKYSYTNPYNKVAMLALYDRANNTLRLVATKISRVIKTKRVNGKTVFDDGGTGDNTNAHQVQMLHAVITPEHFDYFKVQRRYLAPADRQNPNAEGINPFEKHSRADGNGIFHNIDYAAALAAMGKAQELVGASHGFMAISLPETTTRKHTKKSIFRKKVTYYLQMKTKVDWIMSVANSAGGSHYKSGITSAFCAVETVENADGGGGNCPSWAIVGADTTAIDMSNGNLPDGTQYLGEAKIMSQSGWSMFAFVFVIVVAFAVGGYILGPQFFGGVAETIASVASAITPEAAAAIVGGGIGAVGYIGLSNIISGTSAGGYQKSLFGKNVSYGLAVEDVEDLSELHWGSDAANGAAGKAGEIINTTFMAKNPQRDGPAAVKCFLGGGSFTLQDKVIRCNPIISLKNYSVRNSSKDLMAEKAKRAENAITEIRRSWQSSSSQVQQQAEAGLPITQKMAALDSEMAGDGSASILVNGVHHYTVTQSGGKYLIGIVGSTLAPKPFSESSMRQFILKPAYTIAD